MKKILALLLIAALLLPLAACAESAAQPEPETGTEPPAENDSGVAVEEGLFNVDVTMAASFFEDMTAEEIKAAAVESGYVDCQVNEDGSVTYTMSKAKHREVLETLKTEFQSMIAGYLSGDGKVASFTDIQYSDDFSQVDIYVDAEAYTVWDNLYALGFYLAGSYFQSFAGTPADQIDVAVSFIDSATGEVLESASYKDYLSGLASGDGE